MAQYVQLFIKSVLCALPAALAGGVASCALQRRKTDAPVRARVLLAALLWGYAAFLLAALLGTRNEGWDKSFNLRPLTALLAAFAQLEREEIFLIFANFSLFVPLGALLALRLRGGRMYDYVPLFCALASLGVELLQYQLKLGVADINDLLLNSLGGLCGWSLHRHFALRGRGLSDVGFMLPAALALAATLYCAAQPYGTTSYDRYEPDKQQGSVSFSEAFQAAELPAQASVWRVETQSDAQARAQIERIFSYLDVSLDERLAYDRLYVCYAEDKPFELWYDYGEQYFSISNYRYDFSEKLDWESLSGVLAFLRELGITLPEGLRYEKSGDEIQITADFLRGENAVYDGTIWIELYDGALESFRYEIKTLRNEKTVPLISKAALTDALAGGKFWGSATYPEETLLCQSATLQYVQDSRGYYRPYFKICAQREEKELTLMCRATVH